MNSKQMESEPTAARLAEIGAILAQGLLRLRAAKSSPLSANGGESCLDFSRDQRGYAATSTGGVA